MSRFNKQELGMGFFIDGSECIKSANILFSDKSRGVHSQYGILLLHGIELLLKSYLLLKNEALVDDPVKIDQYLKKLGHKYKDIYEECKKYGDEISKPYYPDVPVSFLEVYLDSLQHTYYEDIIGVRYVEDSGLILFDPIIFTVVASHLIRPVHALLLPKVTFLEDQTY